MRLHLFGGAVHQEVIKKEASPWKFGGLTFGQLIKRLYQEIIEDDVLTRSAALAYYFVSALFPMIFFMMAVLGFFARSHDLQTGLLTYIARFIPGDAFTLIQKTLREIAISSSGFKLALGLTLALWSGSGGISSLMDALNRCYHVKETRPWWKSRLISIGLTVAISALIIFALTIILYGGNIAQFVGSEVGLSSAAVLTWRIVQWPIALLFVVVSFAVLYFWGPDAKQKWQWITPGSMVGVGL